MNESYERKILRCNILLAVVRRSGGFLAVWTHAEFFHDLLERLTFEAAVLGSAGHVAFDLAEGVMEIRNCELFQHLLFGFMIREGEQRVFRNGGGGEGRLVPSDVFRLNRLAGRHDNCPLDEIGQFPDVSLPGVIEEAAHEIG